MKLWQKINTISGGTTKSRLLVPLLNEASIWLVNSLPEKFLWTIATETEINGWESSVADASNINEGSPVAYDKILAVYRNDGSANGTVIRRVCKEVPDSLAYAFDESASIYHATKMFPKFYKLSGKLFIKPTPDFNDRTAGTAALTYTKPGASSTTSVSAQGGDKGVVVYAAAPIVDENTESWILVEWENVVIMYAGSLDMLRQSETLQASATTELTTAATLLTTYNSSVPTFTPPTAPSAVLTYNAPTGYTLPTALENVNDSLPTFTPPVMSAPKFSDADTHMTNEDPELVQARAGVIAQQVNEYSASLQGAVQDFTTNLNKFSADVSKAAQDSQVEMASYGAEQRDSVQKFQEDVAQYQNDLQKYTAEVGSKVQEFQSKMAEAKKSLEQATIRLQLSSQYQQKSQDKFQKYSALYQAALRELAAVTGASAAPPQQQGAQRGEEGKST